MRPLLYLLHRSLVGSVRNLRRSPLRLVAAVLMAMWFAWAGLAPLLVRPSTDLGALPWPTISAALLHQIHGAIVVALALVLIALLHQGFSGGILTFSLADIDFLLPTPVPRRSVLLRTLLRDLLRTGGGLVFVAAIFSIQLSTVLPARFLRGVPLAILACLLFLALAGNLSHIVNLLEGSGRVRGQRWRKGLFAATIVTLVATGLLAARDLQAGRPWAQSLGEAMRTVIARVLLAPMQATADVIVAVVQPHRVVPWSPLALLVALALASLLLLLSRRENLYEASLARSLRVAQARRAARWGAWGTLRATAATRPAQAVRGFEFPTLGHGGWALIWKDCAVALRRPGRVLALGFLCAIAPAVIARSLDLRPEWQFGLPAVVLYGAFILGQFFWQSSRRELRHGEILLTLPIPAVQVILAQLAGRVLAVGAFVAVMAGSWGLLVSGADLRIFGLLGTLTPVFVIALWAPHVCSALVWPNAEDTGQNTVGGLVGMMGSMMAIAPGSMALGALWVLKAPIWVTGLAGLIGYGGAGALGILAATGLYRRFDVSES